MKDIDRDRYRGVMRPHTPAERAGLEDSITADGCREPLTVAVLDGARYLIDGFQRLAVCEAGGVEYAISEIAFGTEADLLAWMERHARGRRNQTRTERNYYIGCRYLREKGPVGVHRPAGKKVASIDSTADDIARQERCSHQHVKNCAKLARHLADLNVEALRPIKWAILSEQIKYGKAWVDEVVYLGAGSEEVQALLGEIAKGDAIPPKRVKELLGMASEGGGGKAEFDPMTTPIGVLDPMWDQCPDDGAKRKLMQSVESWLASVRVLVPDLQRGGVA